MQELNNGTVARDEGSYWYILVLIQTVGHTREKLSVIDGLRRSLAEHLHVQYVEGMGDAFRPRKSC